uniref:DUF5824 domain-containing protein n=1 Tax=viral metagenome TaxID=1070528 RepID=A0A6C0IIR8_9ZZZZ
MNNYPKHYVPKYISIKDRGVQLKNLHKSRKMYKKGKYFQRPKIKTFRSKPSQHVKNAKELYKIDNVAPSRELVKATKCSMKTLDKIANKGRGAYYSSGSRPNQSAESWAIARLASAVTGGNASIVDYHLLNDGCKKESKALKLAKQTCKKQNKCTNKNKTRKITLQKKI